MTFSNLGAETYGGSNPLMISHFQQKLNLIDSFSQIIKSHEDSRDQKSAAQAENSVGKQNSTPRAGPH